MPPIMQKKLDLDVRELKQVNIELNRTAIKATADGIVSKLKLRNRSEERKNFCSQAVFPTQPKVSPFEQRLSGH